MKWWKQGPLTVDPDETSVEWHAELERRTWAFESALAEMLLPRFTTEEILDQYLARVVAA